VRRRVVTVALLSAPALLAFVAGTHAQCVEPEGPVHEARGRIVGFVPTGGMLRIAHDEIPGVMAAMTMIFAPCPSVDVRGLAVGDAVRFRFTRGPGGRFLLLSLSRA
jgi:Cu/Ag efflux protein CusF